MEAGKLLADAWLAGKAIDFPGELLPADRSEAYAVQDRMAGFLAGEPGNQVVGWKVGATSRGVQRAEGYDGPIPGRILASTVYGSGSFIPLTHCRQAKVEAEIAFRFIEDPAEQVAPFTQEGLEGIVKAMPAFDITGTRYSPSCRAAWSGKQNMLAGIADNGNGGAIVLGEESPAGEWPDFARLQVDLRINGCEPVPNLWDASRGSALGALAWTLNMVYERGFTVATGDVVLTGSLTAPRPLQPGDSVVCEMPGLGCLRCQVSRA